MVSIGPEAARAPAMARAAEAMLRALGGSQVRVLLPLTFMVDATAQELGLATAGIEEVTMAPVIVRSVRGAGPNQKAQFEVLFPAAVVKSVADARQVQSGEALFKAARGIVSGDIRMSVVSITTEYFAGVPYLYRILTSE